MARSTRRETPEDSAAHVAEEAMPGWKAVKETSLEGPGEAYAADAADDDDAGTPPADAVMPSLDDLKAKYLGAAATASDTVSSDTAGEAADTALVELESGPLKKTVAVSKSKKKVIWSQG